MTLLFLIQIKINVNNSQKVINNIGSNSTLMFLCLKELETMGSKHYPMYMAPSGPVKTTSAPPPRIRKFFPETWIWHDGEVG